MYIDRWMTSKSDCTTLTTKKLKQLLMNSFKNNYICCGCSDDLILVFAFPDSKAFDIEIKSTKYNGHTL